MLGSATLAMVVSSTCIKVPSITAMVIIAVCGSPAAGLEKSIMDSVAGRGALVRAGIAAQRAVMGVDVHLGAHAGTQVRSAVDVVEGDTQRDALHHFDPVAGCVLRGQHREH